MDILDFIFATLVSMGIFWIVIIAVGSWLLARALKSMGSKQRTLLLASTIVIGFALVLTGIGIPLGSIVILTTALTTVFGLVVKRTR